MVGAVLGGENTAPEAAPVPEGDRPRIRYWLREPQGTEEARPEQVSVRAAQDSNKPLPQEQLPAQRQVSHQETQHPAAYPASGEEHSNVGELPADEACGHEAPTPAGTEKRKEQKARKNGDPEPIRVGQTAEERRVRMQVYFTRMLKKAQEAFQKKDYEGAEALCRNILSADPRNVEAIQLLEKAHSQLASADEVVTKAAAERRNREALLEAEEHMVRPPVRAREVRPHWPRRSDDPALTGIARMEQLLKQPVTVDFVKADLEYVFHTFFTLTGINIVADPAALEDKTLTLHVEKMALRSILEFIVRTNEGIHYAVTEDAVWITANEAQDLKPMMYPKIYPIHFGLASTKENSGGGAGSGSRSGSTGRVGRAPTSTGGGGGGQLQPTYLETVLDWLEKEVKNARVLPEDSKWFIDKQSNNLIVVTTDSGHEKMRQLLDAFDQPPIQVLIKARFLAVGQQDNQALGIDVKDVSIPDLLPNIIKFAGNTPTNLPGVLGTGTQLLVQGVRTDPKFEVTLNMLRNNRNTRILSEPQVLAINNKESYINISTHFSYITDLREVTGTTLGGNGTATQDTIAYVPEFDTDEIGFTLYVTPSVGRDLKTINLHVHPVIDSLAEGQNISDFQTFDVVDAGSNNSPIPPTIQRPTIDQTEMETDLVLEDNGYVIIGGLIRNRYETIERKVPYLNKIPGLGQLFKSKSRQKETTNLMIIIEAQILNPRGRTYRTAPAPDDGDIREGGVNRAPMQVSELEQPLHLPAENDELGEATPECRQATAQAPAQNNPRGYIRVQPLTADIPPQIGPHFDGGMKPLPKRNNPETQPQNVAVEGAEARGVQEVREVPKESEETVPLAVPLKPAQPQVRVKVTRRPAQDSKAEVVEP